MGMQIKGAMTDLKNGLCLSINIFATISSDLTR